MKRDEALTVLELREGFLVDDLKSAYRAKARESHPDVGGSVEAFRIVHEAYLRLLRVDSGLCFGTTSYEDCINDLRTWLRNHHADRVPRWEKAPPEKVFRAQVVEALKSRGAMVLVLHGHAEMQTGWPDLYVALNRWSGWLEIKVGKRPTEAHQSRKLENLVTRGVAAMVLRLTSSAVLFEYESTLCREDLWSIPIEVWDGAKSARERGDTLLSALTEATEELFQRA